MTDEKKPPGVENAEEIARLVLEHYIKHYDVVKMKLGHARSATRQSMDELAANQNDRLDGEDRRLREVEAYDRVWEQIIDMFRTAGVSEDDLERIEAILSRIPTLIKKYYDLLVAEDRVLQDLMTELERIEYKQAIAITRKIQEGPDLLSGLDQKEFRVRNGFPVQASPRFRSAEKIKCRVALHVALWSKPVKQGVGIFVSGREYPS